MATIASTAARRWNGDQLAAGAFPAPACRQIRRWAHDDGQAEGNGVNRRKPPGDHDADTDNDTGNRQSQHKGRGAA